MLEHDPPRSIVGPATTSGWSDVGIDHDLRTRLRLRAAPPSTPPVARVTWNGSSIDCGAGSRLTTQVCTTSAWTTPVDDDQPAGAPPDVEVGGERIDRDQA